MATGKQEAAPQVPAKQQGGALVGAEAYAEYAGKGFEQHTKDDYAIPFIGLVQAIDSANMEHFGGKIGLMFNTVTKEAYPDGIDFVPSATQHVFVEWKPRASGGGFVAQHPLDADVVVSAKEKQQFGDYKTPANNDLNETFYVWGHAAPLVKQGDALVRDLDRLFQAGIAFTSTKIKKYKGWMARARSVQIALPDKRRITLPIFAHYYRIKSVMEQNTQGKFANFAIDWAGANAEACRLPPSDEIFKMASDMGKLVEQGGVRGDYSGQTREPGDDGDGKAPF